MQLKNKLGFEHQVSKMLPSLASLSFRCNVSASPTPAPADRLNAPFALADLPREVRAKTIAKYLASLFTSGKPGGGLRACAAIEEWCEKSAYVFSSKEGGFRPCADDLVWAEVAEKRARP